MPTKLIQKGDQLNAVITFTNKITGQLANPTTVLVKVKTPDGTSTTYTYPADTNITNLSTGVYRFLLTVTQTGHYFIHVEGSGSLVGSIEGEFDVDSSQF